MSFVLVVTFYSSFLALPLISAITVMTDINIHSVRMDGCVNKSFRVVRMKFIVENNLNDRIN